MNIRILKSIIKTLFIIAIIGAVVYAGYLVVKGLMDKGTIDGPKTLEQATSFRFDIVDHVESTKNKNMTAVEFKRLFQKNLYEIFPDVPKTRKTETYRVYDSENNLLMTLTDYASESVIEVDIDGEISLFKKYVEPKD